LFPRRGGILLTVPIGTVPGMSLMSVVETEIESSADVDPPPIERRPLNLIPAVIIIALMWAVVIIPGMVVPLTMIHFISMQAGPILGGLAILTWWLTQSAFPWRTRWRGAAIAIMTVIVLALAVHSSLHVLLMVYGLPIALTILVAALLMTRSMAWPSRRFVAWAAFASVFLAAQFVRVGTIDAAFGFSLVSRWTPTAEEQFLASIDPDQRSADDGQTYELPLQPGPDDWAEFRGPQRDGIVRGVSIATDWQTNPPRELWRKPVGPAWSSLCVVGPLLYTQEQRGDTEVVAAYEVATGDPVWTNQTEGRFAASMGGVGPRATPTYHEQFLYVTSANGLVQKLNAATGESMWQYDMMEKLNVKLPMWGFASSPLVVETGNLVEVVVFAGGGPDYGVVTLDAADGLVRWTSNLGTHGYSSPHLATIDGVRQILMASNVGLQAFAPETGEQLWRHDWDIGDMARTTQPTVVPGNLPGDAGAAVYLGTGYGNGTMRLDVALIDDVWTVNERWTANLKPYFNDMVHSGGALYGFDGPIFMAVDAQTGDKLWKKGRYGHGQVLLVGDDDVMIVLTESGELVLVRVNPDKLDEIARLPAIDGVTWNHPVIAGGKLFVRNAETMAAYELPQ
jgi:outer membrane protein assembly factor BamB